MDDQGQNSSDGGWKAPEDDDGSRGGDGDEGNAGEVEEEACGEGTVEMEMSAGTPVECDGSASAAVKASKMEVDEDIKRGRPSPVFALGWVKHQNDGRGVRGLCFSQAARSGTLYGGIPFDETHAPHRLKLETHTAC
jgi:hypothetical protein